MFFFFVLKCFANAGYLGCRKAPLTGYLLGEVEARVIKRLTLQALQNTRKIATIGYASVCGVGVIGVSIIGVVIVIVASAAARMVWRVAWEGRKCWVAGIIRVGVRLVVRLIVRLIVGLVRLICVWVVGAARVVARRRGAQFDFPRAGGFGCWNVNAAAGYGGSARLA